jgi:phosphatidylserine/phosphatidylglycerophosphate/cardiolipin synthase-like enzyme
MSDTDPLKTQRSETVYVGLDGRTATGTCQWLLENCISHPITTGNSLQTFVCGKEGFAHIAADIEAAKGSIDLVCWGFDPAMALQRDTQNSACPWTQGETYGDLLKRKAASGVTVRLLVWYNAQASAKQNSLVGYVVPNAYLSGAVVDQTWDEQTAISADLYTRTGAGTLNDQTYKQAMQQRAQAKKPIAAQRQDYCTLWWREATAGQIPNLEVRCRDGVDAKVKTSVADEADAPSAAGGAAAGYVDEQALVETWATHHQKPILIDYDYADAKDKSKAAGHKAIGYVMGLNSVSDYWDSDSHSLDDSAREIDYTASSDDISKLRARNAAISRKPLRDYACRVEGQALKGVFQNFCNAWNRAALLPKLSARTNARAIATRSADLNATLEPAALAKKAEAALKTRLQVLRTQPEEVYQDSKKKWAFDKSIKHAYFQASSMARNYLYMENQYFFYEEWARHLKVNRSAFMEWVQAAGKTSKDARMLHVIAVIPTPEDAGMVPRTYDTLKALGQASSMPGQNQLVQDHSDDGFIAKATAPGRSDVVKTALKVKQPNLDKDSVLLQDGKSLGMKVLVVKLVTSGTLPNTKGTVHRDIYIHSKLMLADDCFMTLGSANLNQRSMAADSEINIATDNIPHNRALRQRVWGNLTGGDSDAIGGDATPDEMVTAFKTWQDLAANNKKFVRKGSQLSGFIVKFEDLRTATERVG